MMEQLMRSLERGGNPLPQQFQIAHAELAAYIDTATGNMTKGLEELNRAAVSESLLPYTDPTVYPRPVLELLGRTALKGRDFLQCSTISRFRTAKITKLERSLGQPLEDRARIYGWIGVTQKGC